MSEAATSRQPEPGRDLVDVITAIHHPVRRKILEILHVHGPATVSRLAESAEQGVGNVSHHLKVLAEAGLVEPAPELAKDRRERWWRVTPDSVSWSVAEFAGDPVGELVATAAEQQNIAHHVGKLQQWYGRRESFSEEWVRAAFSTESWVMVTAAELAELGERINALILEYADRSATDRADEGSLVPMEQAFVFAHGAPAKP